MIASLSYPWPAWIRPLLSFLSSPRLSRAEAPDADLPALHEQLVALVGPSALTLSAELAKERRLDPHSTPSGRYRSAIARLRRIAEARCGEACR